MKEMKPLSANNDDFCFADTETRGLPDLEDPRWGDVTKCGARRYGTSCRVVIFRYCIGEHGEMQRWDLEDFDGFLDWDTAPKDLRRFRRRALKGKAWFVFWNSFFDRNVCNGGMSQPSDTLLALPVRAVIDAMAQAVASNLPAKLEGASKAIGRGGKVDEGKSLINLFAPCDGGTPQSHPEEWARYKVYADVDVEELREVYFATRALWRWEWEEFWTSETINDRGLPIDRPFIERAAVLADTYAGQVNDLVNLHSRGHCWSVNQHVKLADWVADELEHLPEAFDILVKKYEEDLEGDGLVATKVSLERTRVEKLIPYLERLDKERGLTDDEYDILLLLEVRLYGASATPKKFAKAIPMLDERDRLCGQYTFNGAQQTGRYSSRGLQVHNLVRAFLGMEQRAPEMEAQAIEFINDITLQE
ncbi:DNA polymerase [Octadecabacter Antarctic BD virus 1]|nr:DNA polymerase [Octadecabacter Antarctic BD virus 1]